MTNVLGITAPIYLALAVGFAATHWRIFSLADMRVLGRFITQFALPCLVFGALSKRSATDVLNGSYLLAYAGGSVAVMLLGMAWSRWGARRGMAESAFNAMGMSCSNSGFIGYPLALQLLGPVAGVGLALCMLVENIVMIPILLVLADTDVAHGGAGLRWHQLLRQALWRLITMPLFVGMLLGLLFAWFGWQLPAPLDRTVTIFSGACTAVSLFVIGGTLVGLKLRGMGAHISQIVFGKLLLHPLAVGLCLLCMPSMDPALRTAAVVFAAVPMMGIYPVLAQKYGLEVPCAAAQLATTMASFFSLSLVLWLLHWMPGWVL